MLQYELVIKFYFVKFASDDSKLIFTTTNQIKLY
jgi:hypothetical protein